VTAPQLGHFLKNGPADAPLTLALAHGAGAPMDHPFMTVIAHGLGERGWRVVRFEFPYMQKARATGRPGGPNPAPLLLAHYAAVMEALGDPGCLGYPFHPPGKPERLRVHHLSRLQTPALFVQGERDTFGTREEIGGYELSAGIRFAWMPDGDHSFKPRKSSGTTNAENLQRAVEAVDAFLRGLTDG
jgi:predicted alpha/beta-hydrolase family hydrolase